MKRRVLSPAIESFDPNANVLVPGFGVLDEDVEVFVFIEHTRVEQLVFEPVAGSPLVFFDHISYSNS